MPTPSNEIIQLLSAFATATTNPIFTRMIVLMCGAILAPGARTITSCLRAVGLEEATDFASYHRVLSRAKWSPFVMSRILLGLLVASIVPENGPLVLVVDDTLERRRGKNIRYKSLFRDAVRSTREHTVTTYGVRWVCVALLVNTPWNQRPWALPVLVVPALSERRAKELKKVHRSPVSWATLLLEKVRRWYPDREVVLVGDGGYACVKLVAEAQIEPSTTTVVTRLRMDACLYDEPSEQPSSKRGPKPKKGARQPSLYQRLQDKRTRWQTQTVRWYRGQQRTVIYTTGVALWHTQGSDPVPIRWVLLKCPDEPGSYPVALLSSDTQDEPLDILGWFLGRWSIEVTFEEMRACLGFETQRQWSDKATLRTAPALFGMFSVVTLIAHRLYPKELPIQRASWYEKEEATFSDALRAVRAHLWRGANYKVSPLHPGHVLIPITVLRTLKRAAGCAS
jgi:hypothetical protein